MGRILLESGVVFVVFCCGFHIGMKTGARMMYDKMMEIINRIKHDN